ncbi:MAG: Rpn family recombination-promoting nuclease/putative transposase [Eubacteriales bacterium]
MTEERKEVLEEVLDLAKPDPELKDFFRKPEHFADVFNGACFGGEQVLAPENLQEIDTDVSGILVCKEYRESLVRNRDVLKKAMDGTKFVILGIENQSVVDYTMPLRVMVYDGMNYTKELKSMKDEVDMKKEDIKVTPIITIVMYYGKKAWNGPTSLKGMMGDIPENLEKYISDYKMNLVEILHDEDYKFQNEDVKMLFEYSQAIVKKDRNRIAELEKEYRLSEDVIYAMGKFIDIGEAKEKLRKEKVEDISMCELFDDIRAEGKAEGKAEAIVKLLRRFNTTTEEIVVELMRELRIKEEEAKKYL